MPAAIRGFSVSELWHPWLLVFLLGVWGAYALVVGPLRRERGWGPPVAPGQAACFFLALAVVYLAEGTPLHLLSERFLLSAHMLQHVLLTMGLPPLLLLGTPGWLIRPFLRPRPVAAAFRLLTHPLVALVTFHGVYSLWHLPALYQAALYNRFVHLLEHATIVSTATLMWWALLSPLPEFPRLPEPAQILYVFLMSAAEIGVFAYITYNNQVLYDFYARAPRVWGIDPRMDQQLAGIVMKVAPTLVMVSVMAAAFFRWARREEAGGGLPAERKPPAGPGAAAVPAGRQPSAGAAPERAGWMPPGGPGTPAVPAGRTPPTEAGSAAVQPGGDRAGQPYPQV
ncbi:MAG: cytochrome c oxidase assembly protein [Bacillota bacterium]